MGGPPVAGVAVIENVVIPPSVGVEPDATLIDAVGRADTAMLTAGEVVPPAVAVTLAALLVVNVVRAIPAVSVFATAELNVPAVVAKLTGTPARGLPDASTTDAVMVVLPPPDGTDVGLAVRLTRPVAAAPTEISIGVDAAPPEIARTDAFP